MNGFELEPPYPKLRQLKEKGASAAEGSRSTQRTMTRFDDPYCYPGTSVLKNKQDLRDAQGALEIEREFSLLRRRELEVKPVRGNFDLDHLDNERTSIRAFKKGSGEPFRILLEQALEPPMDGLSILDDDLYRASPPAAVTNPPSSPSAAYLHPEKEA